MKFSELASAIEQTHLQLQQNAVKAVNQDQTIRNWLIGFYIVEFEQNGEDRAQYGSQLLKRLERKIGRKGLNVTLFQRARLFYTVYPRFAKLIKQLYTSIYATPLPESRNPEAGKIYATLLPKLKVSEQETTGEIPAEKLLSSISFAHFTELVKISNPNKRMN